MPAAHAILLAAPVVDVDGTLLIQGGLFLVMVVALDGLLFKPWLAVQERRRESTRGALETAERLQAEAQARAEEYERRLRAAREQAQDVRSAARKEGQAEQAGRLAAARDAARHDIEAARAKTAGEAERARSALAGRVDELAREIVAKILGRAA
jgi:F-type H+-transporting ATPase subunit b